MFTGIVSGIGKITSLENAAANMTAERVFVIETPYSDASLGESIAINGACLTVAEMCGQNLYKFYLSQETCQRTNLGRLESGSRVNLERALKFEDRLSGHLVQGHVDGTGTLVEVRRAGESYELKIDIPEKLCRYVIEKGSITIDGTSLTVNSISGSTVSLMIIPHTWQYTTLGSKRVGEVLNLEVDMIAKYVERLTQHHGQDSRSN